MGLGLVFLGLAQMKNKIGLFIYIFMYSPPIPFDAHVVIADVTNAPSSVAALAVFLSFPPIYLNIPVVNADVSNVPSSVATLPVDS